MTKNAHETIAPDDPRLALEGLVALRRQGNWWQPWRLPPDRIETAHAPTLTERARMPAGARIGMRTDATSIAIAIDIAADDPRLEQALVDVVIDRQLAHRLPVAPGGADVVTELPGGVHEVELWLPHVADVRIGAITLAGHREVAPAPRSGPRWITYGSSITHCVEAAGPSETWPALVARQNDWRLTCLGFGGDCHLDPVVARTIRDADADLISLCLGINIYGGSTFGPRSLASAVSGFIETVRDGHPETPIAVISPIISPDREQNPNPVGLTLEDVREHVTVAVETLSRLGDPGLVLIDGLDVMGTGEAHMLPDNLHPSAEGYRLMAERIGPRLQAVLAGGAGSVAAASTDTAG
jgi:hypothetical protein